MAQRLQRWLARHPRVILAVLLAFGVELAPPASGVVSHRHSGGGIAHTHAGRVRPASALRMPATAPADGGQAFTSAAAADAHEHVLQPLLLVPSALSPSAEPTDLVSVAPAIAVSAESAPARGIAQARAPPASPA
jgi:hypothetical protein